MPQVIAGTYELKEKIGAGGGGVVYLDEHTSVPTVTHAESPEVLFGSSPRVRRRVCRYHPQIDASPDPWEPVRFRPDRLQWKRKNKIPLVIIRDS